MDEIKPYPKGAFTFTDRKGAEHRNWKVYYPNLLRLNLSKGMALEVIETLARQLADSERTDLSLHFSGEMEQDEEGET